MKKITRKSSQDTAKREVSRYKDYEDRIKKQSRNPHTRKPIIAPPTFQLYVIIFETSHLIFLAARQMTQVIQ